MKKEKKNSSMRRVHFDVEDLHDDDEDEDDMSRVSYDSADEYRCRDVYCQQHGDAAWSKLSTRECRKEIRGFRVSDRLSRSNDHTSLLSGRLSQLL